MKYLFIILLTVPTLADDWRSNPDLITPESIEYLKSQTQLENLDEVIENLNLIDHKKYRPNVFTTPNPYNPRYITENPSGLISVQTDIAEITNFKRTLRRKYKYFHQPQIQGFETSGVCAFQFSNSELSNYKLGSFESQEAAESAGYTVTHRGHCGTCSSLRDLAMYLEKRNLSDPARRCSKKMKRKKMKACYMEKIEFSPACAETWAYNSHATRKNCKRICIKEYGFFKLMFNRYQDEMAEKNLDSPCFLCDEIRSGPGFKYTAGRTRRNSGIPSGIEREENEIFDGVDYQQLEQMIRTRSK